MRRPEVSFCTGSQTRPVSVTVPGSADPAAMVQRLGAALAEGEVPAAKLLVTRTSRQSSGTKGTVIREECRTLTHGKSEQPHRVPLYQFSGPLSPFSPSVLASHADKKGVLPPS